MKLVIIDPGSGNLASVLRAFQKVAAESGVAAEISVTRDAAEILAADRVVLPGQGAFAACRRGLDALPGAIAALQSRVRGDGVPFLGICVGMQLMATRGLERLPHHDLHHRTLLRLTTDGHFFHTPTALQRRVDNVTFGARHTLNRAINRGVCRLGAVQHPYHLWIDSIKER